MLHQQNCILHPVGSLLIVRQLVQGCSLGFEAHVPGHITEIRRYLMSVNVISGEGPLTKSEVDRIIGQGLTDEFWKLRLTPGFCLDAVSWERLKELVQVVSAIASKCIAIQVRAIFFTLVMCIKLFETLPVSHDMSRRCNRCTVGHRGFARQARPDTTRHQIVLELQSRGKYVFVTLRSILRHWVYQAACEVVPVLHCRYCRNTNQLQTTSRSRRWTLRFYKAKVSSISMTSSPHWPV